MEGAWRCGLGVFDPAIGLASLAGGSHCSGWVEGAGRCGLGLRGRPLGLGSLAGASGRSLRGRPLVLAATSLLLPALGAAPPLPGTGSDALLFPGAACP